MQKWEYLRVCIISAPRMSGGTSHANPKTVYVIGADGAHREWEKQPGDESHGPVVSRLLRQLGDEGYELSGVVAPISSLEVVLYFKRPKE